MSFYNMLFGQNPASDVLLATLGLTRGSVGRFRDCYVKDGRICVYTRNGGGNRECWCRDDPECGRPECKHHVVQREANEYAFMPESEWPDGKAPGNWFETRNGVFGCSYATGRKVLEDRYVCESPCSIDCACPGCVICERLPAHPLYERDEDDDFDCTYATIYFRFPEQYAADLESIDRGDETETPSLAWQALFSSLKVSP